MILVDTSLWVNHLRTGVSELGDLLREDRITTHPFVIGELLCGNLRPDGTAIQMLEELHAVPVATDDEVVGLIRFRRLAGRGIGYLDAHLLASALLSDSLLWTVDSRLRNVAAELGVAFEPAS